MFHSAEFYPGYSFSPEDEKLSWRMLRYWAAFAHEQTGTNTTGANPLWTPFTPSSLASMVFDVPTSQVMRDINKANCDFWDSIGYRF